MLEPIRAKHIQLKKPTLLPVGLRDIRNGCVLDLDFGSITGSTVIDQSGQGNNGTITGAVRAQGMGDLPGLSLDGNDDYLKNMDQSIPATDDFSLFFCIKTDIQSSKAFIFDTRNTGFAFGGVGVSFGLNTSSTDNVLFAIGDGTNYVGDSNIIGSIPVDSLWHFVAVSLNRTTGIATLYVDGVESGTYDFSAVTGSLAGSGTQTIGKVSYSSTSYCDCDIDIARVYDRLLSVQEIRNLMLYFKKKAGLIT